jgi:HD-like signal output (HDOD) protein
MNFDEELHPLMPQESEDPRPWAKAESATEGSWSEILKSTTDRLHKLELSSTHKGNSSFLIRLQKDLAEPDMRIGAYPAVVKQVDHMMRRDLADAFKFSKLLETDPALEHAVWHQANSVKYSRPANSLRGAIARLSQDHMWRLITRVSIESSIWHVPHMKAWTDSERMHAVVSAEVASTLQGSVRCTPYVAALLHNVGKLSVYRAAVRSRRGPLPEAAFVQTICNDYYATIGVLIGRTWDIDPEIVSTIGFHNAPNSAPREHRKTAWLVHLANIISMTAQAEAEGLETDGREVLAAMRGVQFDIELAFDTAHDAICECESFHAAQENEAEKANNS